MSGALVRPEPQRRARVGLPWIGGAAALSVLAWLAVSHISQPPIDSGATYMMTAAANMQAASAILKAHKEALGLLQPEDVDPNRTGMIGSEYTPITSTLGDLPAKRTTTNPDFAAALVKLLSTLALPRGTPVVIVVSGSFVGGNIAAILAAEALGLKPIIITSLTASMWGATDPAFNWMDIVEDLRAHGIIKSRVEAAVLGGEGAVGGGIDHDGTDPLRASAARAGVPIIEARPFAALVDTLVDRVGKALGGVAPGAIINVGGALIGLGTCRESYEFPPGLTRDPLPCTDGTPGLVIRLASGGVPVLHIINIKRLSVEIGLPFDPVPLPVPGTNSAVYGSGQKNPG